MKTLLISLLVLLSSGLQAAPVSAPATVFNVRSYGAAGDGKHLDTAAINRAVDACARAGGGTVYLPPVR